MDNTGYTHSFHPVQDVLYNLFMKYPVIANNVLYNVCETFNFDDLGISLDLSMWCGCHLPVYRYHDYLEKYGVTPACSPTCTTEGALKAVDNAGKPITCKQSICIVDKVKIDVVRSSAGLISINQMCSSLWRRQKVQVSGKQHRPYSHVSGVVKQMCSSSLCTVRDPSDETKIINIL